MKVLLRSLLPLLVSMMVVGSVDAACNANFNWEQIPGTTQIHFHSTSTSDHDIISYQWNFGDGNSGDGQNPYHTYAQPGTYLVCLIITDAAGCVSDICHEVTVQPIQSGCNAAFNWEQIPGSYQIHFNSTSTSSHDIVSYQWNFGDGHTGDGPHPYHTYDEAGTYLVCLIITDAAGCVSDVCHEVTVQPVPSDCNAEFNWEQLGGSYEIHFHSTSTSNHNIISYQWNFGDGHNGDGQNPYHTYDEPGTYLVCLIITDAAGCVSDVCHEVTVQAVESECNAQFTWEQVNGSTEVHFNSTSTSDHDIVSYQWNFGDGHTGDSPHPTHVYDEPGTYLVCLIIENEVGCVSDVCHEVTVEAPGSGCNAEFTWEQVSGTTEVHFNSTSTSDHDIVSYVWHFGDNHNGDGPHPTHVYDQPGTYVVCLIITDASGCVSDVCHEVTVVAPGSGCDAEFTWEQVNGTTEVHFNSTSTSDHDIVSYVWHFGDDHNGDGPHPTHVYNQPGTYLVCLIITDASGCVSDVCHEVTVEAPGSGCDAEFTWEQVNGTTEVHFNSTSTSEHDIVSYVWHFGDNHNGEGPHPTHVYGQPGTYVVCLIITDASGCVSDVCHEVTVEAPGSGCDAEFTWEQVPGTTEVHFNSTSTSEHDIVSYVWHFGDEHNGDGPHPTHVYDQPGTYVVCLIITDASGCVSDVCHEVTVEGGNGGFNANFTFEISQEGTVIFVNNSIGTTENTTWFWDFGDGQTSTAENPQHNYSAQGNYTVCLFMTDTTTNSVDSICITAEFPFSPLSSTNSVHQDYTLLRYTNPAFKEVVIDYELHVATTITFELYHLTGNKMMDVHAGFKGTGRQQERLDVSYFSPGLYILAVTSGAERRTVCLSIFR